MTAVIVKKIKKPTEEYSPTLAFLIDCNSGNYSDWVYINSISEFYKKFNSSSYSSSYEYAVNLLSIGYKIITKNKNTNVVYKNVRIFKNNNYTHIDVNKDYTSNITIGERLYINNLLSFDINILSSLEDQNYILLNNGYYNILVWWNISNRPIEDAPLTTDNYFKLIQLDSLDIDKFIDTLKNLLYKVEKISDDNIRVYNFTDLRIIKNSSSNINVDYTNKNSSYDALAYYYDSEKLIDVICKIPSDIDDISIKIIYDGLKFSFFIYKYSNNLIIYDEYFNDVDILNLLDKVNLQSSLISIVVHSESKEDLSLYLQNDYYLKRFSNNEITFDPKYDELIDSYYFDIYIDLFEEIVPTGNFLFFSKDVNNANENLVIFEDNNLVLKDNNTLDITFAFLYSYILNYSFLGVIDFKFSLENYDNQEENDRINKIKFDNFNYYIDKCRLNNTEVSVIIIKFLLSNYLYQTINYQISEEYLKILLNSFSLNMNKDIVKSITLTDYDDSIFGKLLLSIELNLTYKSIDLIEYIQLDLLY